MSDDDPDAPALPMALLTGCWYAEFPGGGVHALSGDTLTEAHADLCRLVAEVGGYRVGSLQSTLAGGIAEISTGADHMTVGLRPTALAITRR